MWAGSSHLWACCTQVRFRGDVGFRGSCGVQGRCGVLHVGFSSMWGYGCVVLAHVGL